MWYAAVLQPRDQAHGGRGGRAMHITPYLTDEAVLKEVGARIDGLRLERNLSQDEPAANAGVTRRTVVNS